MYGVSLVKKRSRFAIAAEQWFKQNAPDMVLPTADFWLRFSVAEPFLTAQSAMRKTPRWTCMRDLRNDGAFVVAKGKVSLKH